MEIINPFNLKQTAADKLSVVDARARDASDVIVNVEVQTYSHKALGSRGAANCTMVRVGKGTDRLSTALRNWCYLLQHAGEDEPMMSEIKRTDEAIAEADARYRAFIADEAARADLLERDRWRRDLAQRIHDAHEDGVEEGIAKGVERGIEQGIEQGIATVARQMKMRGLDDALIAELTGLPLDTVRTL